MNSGVTPPVAVRGWSCPGKIDLSADDEVRSFEPAAMVVPAAWRDEPDVGVQSPVTDLPSAPLARPVNAGFMLQMMQLAVISY
jgi:hypothetical protein